VIKDVKHIAQTFSFNWCGSKERNSEHLLLLYGMRCDTCHFGKVLILKGLVVA
jgi:hypothetical protein